MRWLLCQFLWRKLRMLLPSWPSWSVRICNICIDSWFIWFIWNCHYIVSAPLPSNVINTSRWAQQTQKHPATASDKNNEEQHVGATPPEDFLHFTWKFCLRHHLFLGASWRTPMVLSTGTHEDGWLTIVNHSPSKATVKHAITLFEWYSLNLTMAEYFAIELISVHPNDSDLSTTMNQWNPMNPKSFDHFIVVIVVKVNGAAVTATPGHWRFQIHRCCGRCAGDTDMENGDIWTACGIIWGSNVLYIFSYIYIYIHDCIHDVLWLLHAYLYVYIMGSCPLLQVTILFWWYSDMFGFFTIVKYGVIWPYMYIFIYIYHTYAYAFVVLFFAFIFTPHIYIYIYS